MSVQIKGLKLTTPKMVEQYERRINGAHQKLEKRTENVSESIW